MKVISAQNNIDPIDFSCLDNKKKTFLKAYLCSTEDSKTYMFGTK